MTDPNASASRPADTTLPPRIGTRIEVRTRFDGTWSRGFEVADVEDDGVRVRRDSDGAVLPSLFRRDEIRRERHRATWWI